MVFFFQSGSPYQHENARELAFCFLVSGGMSGNPYRRRLKGFVYERDIGARGHATYFTGVAFVDSVSVVLT